jgi:superfamily I DNA and RNA helicase
LTNIFRAKGNEASIVYVMGFDKVDNNPKMIVQERNQAFTAMTRTRGWCVLTGIGSKAKLLFTEIERIVTSDPEKITFTVPDRKTIQRNLDSLEYERLRKRKRKARELAEKLESELTVLKDKDPRLVAEIIQRLQGIENSDR